MGDTTQGNKNSPHQNQKNEGGQRKMSEGSENRNNVKVVHLILTTEQIKKEVQK